MSPKYPILEAHQTCNERRLLIEHDAGSIIMAPGQQVIAEAISASHGTVTVACILQKANTLNRNGRVYSLPILKREDTRYQELIRAGSAIGECNHPSDISVNLDNVSHRVTKTWWEGDTLFGQLEIVVSPTFIKTGEIGGLVGDKLAHYLNIGIKLGISSRGLGSVRNVQGKNMVQDDFELVCFDIVSSPSTPGAYLFVPGKAEGSAALSLQENKTESGIYTGATLLEGSISPTFDQKLEKFIKNF